MLVDHQRAARLPVRAAAARSSSGPLRRAAALNLESLERDFTYAFGRLEQPDDSHARGGATDGDQGRHVRTAVMAELKVFESATERREQEKRESSAPGRRFDNARAAPGSTGGARKPRCTARGQAGLQPTPRSRPLARSTTSARRFIQLHLPIPCGACQPEAGAEILSADDFSPGGRCVPASVASSDHFISRSACRWRLHECQAVAAIMSSKGLPMRATCVSDCPIDC